MFYPIDGAPDILRHYGKSEVLNRDGAAFANLLRSDFERDPLARRMAAKGQEGLDTFWRDTNRRSMDGLPTGLMGDQKDPSRAIFAPSPPPPLSRGKELLMLAT